MLSLLADEKRARHENPREKEVWKGSMQIWGKGLFALFVIGGFAGWVTFLL